MSSKIKAEVDALAAAHEKGEAVLRDFPTFSENDGHSGKGACFAPANASKRDLVARAGLNPDEWQISGPVQTRTWDSFDGTVLRYHKFEVVSGETPEAIEEHIDELVARIRAPRKPISTPSGSESDAWAFFMADWQVGKAHNGIGTPELIERVLQATDLAKARIKELRRIGRSMPHGAACGLGDLVEQCTGFYPGQSFQVDRNHRDQMKIAAELITHVIDELSPNFEKFTAAFIRGNHGQRRQDGKIFTEAKDNDDLAVAERVEEAFARAGSTNVEFLIPDDEASMLLELGGVGVGLTHGDLFRKGTTPQAKARSWWGDMTFGQMEVAPAQILVSGHFHHLSVVSYGSKTHIQTPAMDCGSDWFANSTGDQSPAGALTVRFDSREPLGFADLQVLRGSTK